jgi:uncharacterized protein
MKRARTKLFWGSAGSVGFTVLAALCWAAFTGSGLAQVAEPPQRISFQIATGSTSGTYFPVGEMLAGLLSHPPRISRCDGRAVCGPPGLIVSARASEGSIANILDIEHGDIDSGLAQADVVGLAVAGKGPFQKTGPVTHVRVIANLYPEDVHLVASVKAHIKQVTDLRGKRVSLSTQGSGTIATARAVLAAYGLSEKRIKPNYDSSDKAAELLQAGKLDAFLYVGGAPVRLVQDLIAQHVAVLVPISGRGRKRLLAGQTALSADKIPAGVYAGTPAIDTVSVGALWITNESEPANLIYAIVRALYNPVNRPLLDQNSTDSRFIRLALAAKGTNAPFHAGAERFYKEQGVLPPAPARIPARKR